MKTCILLLLLTPLAFGQINNGGGGSGSGTVSANNGSAGAIAGYAAAAGSTTVTPFGMTYSAPTLTISAAGAGNGALALSGTTSGTATITAPAVAGTSTNPLSLSNVLSAPVGAATAPTYSFAGSGNSGLWFDGTGLAYSISGNGIFRMQSADVHVGANAVIGWGNNNNASASSADTAFSRLATSIVQLGNGTANDESGVLRAGNTCRITADVSLTVNVANPFCSFSLPAVAKAWSFRCDILWAITAGSGTNNFALGVNPSQTPTGTTNAEAQVYTATAGTQTMGSTAISASGADVILTGATYTPAATVQLAKISGTLLASGTAGTFAIQATANGTTATAAVKAGSACWLN